MRRKNRLRKKMAVARGEERKKIVEEYKRCRRISRKILNAKERRRQEEMNARLESFRGKDEKRYWKILKDLAGINKKREELPDEVRLGERKERGEKRKEVWNEAFSKLGEVDEDDRNFDRKEYFKIKEKVEWEREMRERTEGELDGEIEMRVS